MRQPTADNDFPIFALDNDPKLAAEIAWESGAPRWVFHGTPAGGLGLSGFLSQGLVAVVLVAGPKHAAFLQRWTVLRIGEGMLDRTSVLNNAVLAARLNVMSGNKTVNPKPASASGSQSQSASGDDPTSDEKDEKKEKKDVKKDRTTKKKKKDEKKEKDEKKDDKKKKRRTE